MTNKAILSAQDEGAGWQNGFGLFASVQPAVRSGFRWVRVYWLLAAVVFAGVTSFRGPVANSISSTPHPELVYAIFAVAAFAAVLLGIALNDYVKEHSWFDALKAASPPDQDRMIYARTSGRPMTSLYRMFVQTRGLPLAVRQPALEDELTGAESQMLAKQSLANLLSGSLVGLGLVGTFIGLLQTLSELSGVFAALGGGNGQDSAAMFSTMIVRLQGPMQGMGTAFVASLYGLLGSLVMGLTANGVRSAGDRLFGDVRQFMSDEIYPSATVSVLGLQPATDDRSQALSIDQWAQLFAVIREEHRSMRDLFIQWEQSFSKRFDQLANVASNLNHQLVETVDFVGEQAELNAKRIEEVSTMEGRLAAALDETGTQVVDQIDSFRKDLIIARARSLPIFGRVALILAVLGALAGLAAAALSWTSRSSNDVLVVKDGTSSAPAPSQKLKLAPPKTVIALTDASKALPKPVPAMDVVVVKSGQSLSLIAISKGLPLEEVLKANPQISKPALLMPGDRVNVPKSPKL